MSILVDERTSVIVYGITGSYGGAQVKSMIDYGTNVLGGVSASKAGMTHLDRPIFGTAKEAVEMTNANTAIFYLPAGAIMGAVTEAIDAGVKLAFIATEGVPVHDVMILREKAKERGVWIVGPNSLGLTSPGKAFVGSIAPEFTSPGGIGICSRSGTVSLAISSHLTMNGIGQSTVISMGGDPVLGRNPIEYLLEFNKDDETTAMVLIGEIGGMKEYEVCERLGELNKPLIAYIGGKSAREGKRMGHMGAIIGGAGQDARSKMKALEQAGAIVVDTLWDIADVIKGLG
ncbi:MAG: succinate--CoA ligase subunit alpha [Oscillospiraceae bacterium]|nr:succinate--CoA ligase subunit alpha [Oscillospiraceae bacterium]